MKRLLAFGMTVVAMTGFVQAGELEVGQPMPSVKAKNQSGETVDLAEAAKKGFVLVYFYPKADTPGCTKQACSLRDSYTVLTEKGVKLFGVSTDSVADQKEFAEKYKLPFELLADKSKKVVKAFGVPATMGFAKRQAYLFKEGKLVWRDLKASTEKQAADILAQLPAETEKIDAQEGACLDSPMEHHVYFWLKEEKSSAADREKFEAGLEDLLKISFIGGGTWGKPAGTEERPVSVNTWDYALSLKFDNVAQHDAYQIDPAHEVFVNDYKDLWEKVMVMDVEPK